MRVAIHQPQYWPWPPYLHKVLTADVFVYLDTVQYSKGGLQNRNKIKTAAGAHWLTLPIDRHSGRTIGEKALADPRVPLKHWQLVADAYRRSPGLAEWGDDLETLLANLPSSLADAAIASTEWLLDRLGADCRRIRASSLEAVEGRSSELVASICAELGATEYLSGRGALDYLEPRDFEAVGCTVSIQRWTSPVYEQQYPDLGFIADLSALDLVLNRPDGARDVIAGAGGWEPAWPAA